MSEELMQLIREKRAWTEAAKCAEKEGSIVVADYCRAQAKDATHKIVEIVKKDIGK